MAIERWRPRWGAATRSPFGELESLERRFEDMLGASHLPFLMRRAPWNDIGWTPAIEVFDKDDRLVVKAEIPGMKEEDIDISVEDNTLTLRGERKAETEVKEEDYYCCECSYGTFFRSMNLPSKVDADKIEANYEDGILEVTLHKAAEVKPKKVKVAAKKKEKAGK